MSELENFRFNWGMEIAKTQSTLGKRCCCGAIKKYLDNEINDVNEEVFQSYMYALNRSYDVPKDIFGIIYEFIGDIKFDYICNHCGNANINVLEYKKKEIYFFRKYNDDKINREKEQLELISRNYHKYQNYKHLQLYGT